MKPSITCNKARASNKMCKTHVMWLNAFFSLVQHNTSMDAVNYSNGVNLLSNDVIQREIMAFY